MNDKAYSAGEQSRLAPCYLILQGLGTPFFKKLAAHLGADGAPVHKVNFCGGDRWFSGNAKNHRFNGKPETLQAFYRDLINKYKITTILLFGDCRAIHSDAIEVAKENGLTVWAFEEGYTRPGFITCEQGGTNDFSPLPRSPEAVRARAASFTESEDAAVAPALPNPMPPRVRMDLWHHLGTQLLRPLYFRYQTHRPHSMLQELGGWLGRFWRRLQYRQLNAALIKRYEMATKPYFFVPLQLNSDYQIREHSDYAGTLEFIRDVVASFAKNAPKGTQLLFKSHPLDNGMIDYRNYIAMAAMKHAVDGRIDYIEGGDLERLLKHTEGVVLINSTVGYAALKKAKPLKVMGRAIYNMPGLACQLPLDKFWKKAPGPDVALIGDFLKVVRHDSQIKGDFFTREGIEMAAYGAYERIKAAELEACPPTGVPASTHEHGELVPNKLKEVQL